jgi:hypothetical protein
MIGMLENLEIADEVTDHKADQDHASERHDDFPADRGAEEGANEIHRKKKGGKRRTGGGKFDYRSDEVKGRVRQRTHN